MKIFNIFLTFLVLISTSMSHVLLSMNQNHALAVGALLHVQKHEEKFLDDILAKHIPDLPETCVVCQDGIEYDKNNTFILKCDHGYHKRCIVQLALATNEHVCPLCREPYNLKYLLHGPQTTPVDPYFDDMLPLVYKEHMMTTLLDKKIITPHFNEVCDQLVCSQEKFSRKFNTLRELAESLFEKDIEPLKISFDDIVMIMKAFWKPLPGLTASSAVTAFFTSGLSYCTYQLLKMVPTQSLPPHACRAMIIGKMLVIGVMYSWLFLGTEPIMKAWEKTNERKKYINTAIATYVSTKFFLYGISMGLGLNQHGFGFQTDYSNEVQRVFRDLQK